MKNLNLVLNQKSLRFELSKSLLTIQAGKLLSSKLSLILVFIFTSFFVNNVFAQGCNDLFFSEYLEGSTGNNKCVEIYNPTNSAVILSTEAYKVQVFANGASSASFTINLTGTIAAYGTYTLCNTGAGTGLLALSNQTSGNLSHNGDDALALVKGAGNTFVDIFGNIGNDPGTSWTSGVLSTQDQVLRRKSTVQSGIITNPGGTGAGAFTTLGSEWDTFSDTDYTGFGVHTSTCLPPTMCSISDISISNISSCNDNGTPLNATDDYFTADVSILYADKPSLGTLNLSGDIVSGVSSAAVGAIGSSSHTFTGLQFAADNTAISITASFSDDSACFLTENNVGIAPASCSVIPACALPFFSEYLEGSGNNKCVEIYNPSGSSIDLAAGGYKIEMYFNGASGIGTTINLTGILNSGDVYVVCQSGATSDFTGMADQLNGSSWYNGDDAVVLRNAGGILDVIGQIGVDPGTNWSDFDVETSEQTLRRYSFIQKGDNNGSDVFNPGDEWETYPQNTLWGLGYHATECQPSLPDGWNPSSIGCNSGTSAYNSNTNTWTQTSNCFNPASGADDLTFVFEELCGDGEIIAQYMGVTPFGFAGLMMRENATASSKHVWLFNRANSNTSWSIRSTTGAAPLIQAKPHLNRTWMKLTRTGNVFKGYLSTNGLTWQLMFQSATTLNECLLVGIATHSNVDGNMVTSMFKNVEVLSNRQRLSINNLNEMDLMAENRTYKSNGINVYPNPIGEKVTIEFNGSMVTAESTLMQIVDLNGRLVLQQTMENRNEDKISLDVSILNAGIYFLKLSAGPFNEVIKLVKH